MRVLYYFFSYPHLWKIAKHLQNEHDWEPVYWGSSHTVREEVERAFPGITFQEQFPGERAIHTNELAHVKPAVLDKILIDALAVDQSTAMKIFHKADATGHAFTFDDMVEHYYESLKFWLTVIREKKIDMVVAWASPHGVDYVLYELCKHLGIKVLYLDGAFAITKDTHLIASSIEDKAKLLRQKLQDTSVNYFPHPKTLERIRRAQGDYETGKPEYMGSAHAFGETGRYLKKALKLAKDVFSLIRYNPFGPEDSYLKFKSGPYKDKSTEGNRLQNFLYWRRIGRNGKRYKKIYDRYVVEADLSKDFVYFAASFQPEATTNPDAGVYYDQVLVLEMLSEAIPDDWMIYYKEHPSTFESILWQDHYRSERYYERVSRIPKLKMVNYKLNTFQMVDRSRAVATPTGTAGWEAVVRGKPSLIFGEPWYSPCEGVFKIESREQLKSAIDRIRSGYRPDPEQLLRFAGVVDQFCCKDLKYWDISARNAEFSDLDEEMKRYAEYFARAYELYFNFK